MMKTDTRGFTLIELMVAITLMLMLMAIMFQTFRNANQVSRKTQGWIEIHQNARSLFEFMERDISGSILAGRTKTSLDGKYFQIDGDAYTDAAGIAHDQHSIRFLTRTMNPGYADMAEVGYYLEPVPDEATGIKDTRKTAIRRYIDYVGGDDTNGDDLTIANATGGSETDTVWASGKSKGYDIIASGVTDLAMKHDGTDFAGWANLTTLPNSIEITAYITDSNGIFLYGKTRDHPFCGSGIKFVHTVLVKQE